MRDKDFLSFGGLFLQSSQDARRSFGG